MTDAYPSNQNQSKEIPKKSNHNKRKFEPSFFGGDDPFALIAGGEEGGFLSLEEIDEVDYELIDGMLDENVSEKPKAKKLKSKKRKKENVKKKVEESGEDSCVVEGGEENEEKSESSIKKRNKNRRNNKKKKKKKVFVKKDENEGDDEESCPELVPILADDPHESEVEDDDQLLLNDDEVSAWKELRLHPLIIKSIRRLGFREPTPIQKACIPAAAHKGKDVIGAAETGSGKTLAFGLPILQRLLEEREKAARSMDDGKISVKTVERSGSLRALIITPTRELAKQVSDHIKAAAKNINISVKSIAGGLNIAKQERILKRRPEIIVGTPGRLWELMLGGNEHLVELHSLSFFVLDEADRMIERGHFRELQYIIDMLPTAGNPNEQSSHTSQSCQTIPNLQRKKRQTCVFSATLSLSDKFRKKLKRPSTSKSATTREISSIETLSERAGIRPDAAIVDLTSATIVADKLVESFIECREEDKDAYLYYILSVHGQGRTIVFCTSIAALRRISALLRILGIDAWTYHAQKQKKARPKALEDFSRSENGVLIATDAAARGLDLPGVRTVVLYQLPHSTEVYIHRIGRTARASSDGCCISLISPSDKAKFISLCKSMEKESLRQFPLDDSYLPEVMKRMSLARQIDKLLRKNSLENVKKNWLKRNAESLELTMEESDSEEEALNDYKKNKFSYLHFMKLQQDLNNLLAQPLQPKSFSRRYLAGAGIPPLLQKQLVQLNERKAAEATATAISSKKRKRKAAENPKERKRPSFTVVKKRPNFTVIGQDCVEPLQALRNSGHEVFVNVEKSRESRIAVENLKRKRRDEKKKAREQQKKKRKQLKGAA